MLYYTKPSFSFKVCFHFISFCREDVVSILVKVNQNVSQTIVTTKAEGKKAQVPEPRVRLTKKFYLFPVESKV